jgi:DNA-binding LytR/AlgR family response regulator
MVKSQRPAEPAQVELPLSVDQIDWIAAAGNYVEIRGAGRTLIRRMPLSAVERELDGRGFVRIHRSRLVRRDRIVRVRPDDVILLDGTSLKIGKRYRAALND